MSWWYLVALAGVCGLLVGFLGCWLWMINNVRMFRTLWENEKAGNFIMTERLTKLEEEREDL